MDLYPNGLFVCTRGVTHHAPLVCITPHSRTVRYTRPARAPRPHHPPQDARQPAPKHVQETHGPVCWPTTHNVHAAAPPPASTVPATLNTPRRLMKTAPAPGRDTRWDPCLNHSQLTRKYAMFRSIQTRPPSINLVYSHGSGVRMALVSRRGVLTRCFTSARRGRRGGRGGVASGGHWCPARNDAD